jgi:hypothetical protein
MLTPKQSASAAVIVRLAYVQTFRDPEFLYATVPIAIWSEVEMSLAITAGSLPTLRPLYRVMAKNLSWKTSFFSARRSYKSMDTASRSKREAELVETNSNRSGFASCSDSERKIVDVESVECRPVTQGKHIGITKVTDVRIDFDNNKN